MRERKSMYKIQENFLDTENFKQIKDVILNSNNFPWYYSQLVGQKYISNIYFN